MRWLGSLILVGGLWVYADARGPSEEDYWLRRGGVVASAGGALLYLEGLKRDLVERLKAPAKNDKPRTHTLPPRSDER